jgi:hypothetical protein
VNRAFREGGFVSESGKSVEPGSGQTSKHCLRSGPKQRRSQILPVSKRAGLGDHHSAGGFLPAPGGYLPPQLVCCHEPERIGCADHAFVISKNVD